MKEEEMLYILQELKEIYSSPDPFKDDKDYDRAVAIQCILDLYQKEKEKNKKVKKFCKEKSTFQTFGDEEMKYILETYINRLKHRILDLLED